MNLFLRTNISVLRKNKILVLSLFIFILYYIPYFYLGENMFIGIWDSLDNTTTYLKIIADQGDLFNSHAILPTMYGVKWGSFYGYLSFRYVLYYLLPPYWAYLMWDIVVRFIGFLGMYLLLDRHILKGKEYGNFLAVVCSTCFALIYYSSDFELSVPGTPFLLYAFLNLQVERKKLLSYIIIVLIPIHSWIALTGFFICTAFGIYYLYLVIKDHKLYSWFLLGLFFLGTAYLANNIPLLKLYFGNTSFVPHRIEFGQGQFTLSSVLEVLNMFNYSQPHTGRIPVYIIIYSSLFVFLINKGIDSISKKTLVAIAAIFLIMILYGAFKSICNIPLVREFQFERFYFLLPPLWFILFAVNLRILYYDKHKINGKVLFYLTIIYFIVCSLRLNPEYTELKSSILGNRNNIEPTYAQYYDTKLFDQVANYIGKDRKSYKIVNLGIYPAVAQYNGFYTLDSYQNLYSLEYKHKFREIIANELDKSEMLKEYFDKWGNRCYIFSSELEQEYLIGKNRNISVKHLDINIHALKAMGGVYIFSAVPILNAEELGIKLEKEFTTDESFWKIHLYSLNDENQKAPK